MFTKEVLRRFNKPKNAGNLEKFNGIGRVGDPKCSDVVEIKVQFGEDKVIDAKFKVFGCPGAISTTDVFIDLVKGKTIENALLITEKEISDALGGLSTESMHCANLPIESFKKAVEDYQKISKNENHERKTNMRSMQKGNYWEVHAVKNRK